MVYLDADVKFVIKLVPFRATTSIASLSVKTGTTAPAGVVQALVFIHALVKVVVKDKTFRTATSEK